MKGNIVLANLPKQNGTLYCLINKPTNCIQQTGLPQSGGSNFEARVLAGETIRSKQQRKWRAQKFRGL